MKRAVFLDRDGVILALTDEFLNELSHVRQMRLLPGAAKGIRMLNKAGFLVFIHTNQAVVARGRLTEEKLQMIHRVLLGRLKKNGARIDAIYYCPHHPRGSVKKYRIICACRKPGIGNIRKAARQFSLNLRQSFIVGDNTRDILTGKRAHMKMILVKTGNAGKDGEYAVKPDAVVKNLLEAAKFIKKRLPRSDSG